MRTGTLALFRDFHDDNRFARDSQGETSKKMGRKERMTATGMVQGVAEESEGMYDELIPLAEWEIDLGNPAFPRADCSTFLTEQSA